jgi:hypothetical protein
MLPRTLRECRARGPWLGPAVAVLLASLSARADGTADARALYYQGAAAFDAGDFARAAALFADADALSPNPTVLQLALGASLKAGDAVLGEDLALRADARGATDRLAEMAGQAHARFETKVGRVRIVCIRSTPCVAHIGSMQWAGGETHAVAPGIVDVSFDGAASHVRVEVAAGRVTDLVQPRAAAPSPLTDKAPERDATPRTDQPGGLPPAVFWGGVVLTAGLGAATTVSGLDAQARRNDFLAARTPDNQSAGQAAEVRTNVLLAGAIVCAVATATVGLFFTRWRSPPGSTAPVSPGRIEW